MKKSFVIILISIVLMLSFGLTACASGTAGIKGPQGDKGQQGDKGPQGESGNDDSSLIDNIQYIRDTVDLIGEIADFISKEKELPVTYYNYEYLNTNLIKIRARLNKILIPHSILDQLWFLTDPNLSLVDFVESLEKQVADYIVILRTEIEHSFFIQNDQFDYQTINKEPVRHYFLRIYSFKDASYYYMDIAKASTSGVGNDMIDSWVLTRGKTPSTINTFYPIQGKHVDKIQLAPSTMNTTDDHNFIGFFVHFNNGGIVGQGDNVILEFYGSAPQLELSQNF